MGSFKFQRSAALPHLSPRSSARSLSFRTAPLSTQLPCVLVIFVLQANSISDRIIPFQNPVSLPCTPARRVAAAEVVEPLPTTERLRKFYHLLTVLLIFG